MYLIIIDLIYRVVKFLAVYFFFFFNKASKYEKKLILLNV